MQAGHHQMIGGRHLFILWRFEFSNSCHKIGSKKNANKIYVVLFVRCELAPPKNYAHAHTKMLAFTRTTQMPTVGADEWLNALKCNVVVGARTKAREF